ncbi:tetratricopeptide repeat protein [Coleofasciculus sp. FACHB-SPT9]|uniref:CHAT domain-containing protein n=1 Tax=Cyanophyceae TaxID=3028117 RepID=UPI001681F4F3|nr:tetratricopeptide repeat protein [Coleofasciculus sp. FACHB-SPT9]MBD1890234.1 tetratricopeptide repeat protein [Coleofasciculus sp. FACHB-SPT9]
MCPRPKSVGFALTQFSVGIATLLLSFAPPPTILSHSEVVQAQTIQEPQAEAERLLKQGNRQRRADEYTAALESYQQALKIYQELKTPQGEMKALHGLVRVYLAQKNYPQAIEYAQKRLELARTIQDYESEYGVLESLYEAYMKVANYAKAIETAEQMLALAPKLDSNGSTAFESLAQAYAASGNQAKAIDYYEQGLKIARENREPKVEISFLTGLGKAYHQQGNSAKAAASFKQAFKIVYELNDREIDSSFLSSLGDLAGIYLPKAEVELITAKVEASRLLEQCEERQEEDQFASALQFCQQALKIYQELKDTHGQFEALEALGGVYRTQGKYPEAIEYDQKRRELARAVQDYKHEREALWSLYKAYMKVANYAKAIETAEQMLALAPKPDSNGLTDLESLAQAYAASGNQAKAIDYYEQGLKIARENRKPKVEISFLTLLGKVYHQQGDSAKAADYFNQAFKIVQERNNQEIDSSFLNNLGNLAGIYLPKVEVELITAKVEASRLLEQCENQQEEDQIASALQFCQQALKIYQELKDTQGQIKVLERLAYAASGNQAEAIGYYEQGLKIARESRKPKVEISFLTGLGKAYHQQGDSAKAADFFKQAFKIVQELDSPRIESKFLSSLGDLAGIYLPKAEVEASRLLEQCTEQRRERQFASALQLCQQGLKIYQELKDTQGQFEVLEALGRVYSTQDKHPEVIEYAQKRLDLARAIQDYESEEEALESLYEAYMETANYAKAIETAEQRLELAQKHDKNIRSELSDLERAYDELGDQTTVDEFRQKRYLERLKEHQQELTLARKKGDRESEMEALEELGDFHLQYKEFAKAVDFHEQGLKVARENHEQRNELDFLKALGAAYAQQGNSAKATDYLQQVLNITRVSNDSLEESEVLQELGDIYLPDFEDYVEGEFANYAKGIEYYEQALAVVQNYCQKNCDFEDTNLDYIFERLGDGYKASGNPTKALENYQKVLTFIEQEDEDNPAEKASLLQRMAESYIALGDYTKAIEYSQQQLAISGRRWDYSLQKSAFRNLGLAYQRARNPVKALESYQMELALSQERNDRNNQVNVLNSVASLLVEQNKPELAIVFYKQSVNVIETTRQELRQLPKRTQEAYTRKVEGTYRRLADLLLSQGRIGEAEQVLELLRIQEIRNYTRDAGAGEQTSGVTANPIETQVLQTHGTLIAFGQKVVNCQQSQCNQLSQLLDQREVITKEFNRAVEALEKTVRDNRQGDPIFTDPNQLFGNPDQIVSAQPGTVLLQTLVLSDKLWVLWASKGGVTKSIPVPVGQKQLSETVLKFRELLQNPTSDIQELQATGKQLYEWLIPKELQAEFTANSIQNLVFSLDHVTRYIPMAALFDGQQYLAQRYTLSTIISTNTQMGNSQVLGVQNTSILALGLSEAKAGFNPLPNVPTELDAIVRQSDTDSQGIYQGNEYLNSAFTWRTLRDKLSTHNILHIATHGKFEPGSDDASFLVMGDGEKLPISQIKTLTNLGNLQLVALSACETALGGTGQDGTEISGISFYFLNNGAKAVMASLWAVNDGSTSLLMQQFYKNLATSQKTITKAEALRQAQLSLLTKQVTAKDAPQRSDAEVILTPKPGAQLPRSRTPDFSHPYYWAPFILIGNSL